MFRMISIISFLAVLGGIGIHHLLFPCGYRSRLSPGTLIRKKVHLLTLLFLEQNRTWPGRIRKLAFLLGLLSFCVLLVTGFGPLIFGCRLHGYLLMIHATFAPVFIACAAVVTLTGAAQYAFSKKDIEGFPCPRWSNPMHRPERCWMADGGFGVKAGFWVLVVLSVPVTLTMVLSMLPLFGPDGQEFLYQAHRCCGLVFALVGLVELYMLIRVAVIKDMER